MRLILGGVNGSYLTNILLKAQPKKDGTRIVEEVWAAVAYATGVHDANMLIRWCFDTQTPLKLWGRLDEGVAVDVDILNLFLDSKSANYVCKLVKHHHAKIIWWRGYGVYIGSANLTENAWYTNIEAGCFFEENEIDTLHESELQVVFEILDENATPLTQELRDIMIERGKKLKKDYLDSSEFWAHPSVKNWSGLVKTTSKSPIGN